MLLTVMQVKQLSERYPGCTFTKQDKRRSIKNTLERYLGYKVQLMSVPKSIIKVVSADGNVVALLHGVSWRIIK